MWSLINIVYINCKLVVPIITAVLVEITLICNFQIAITTYNYESYIIPIFCVSRGVSFIVEHDTYLSVYIKCVSQETT